MAKTIRKLNEDLVDQKIQVIRKAAQLLDVIANKLCAGPITLRDNNGKEVTIDFPRPRTRRK